jgi:hypothetical protein
MKFIRNNLTTSLLLPLIDNEPDFMSIRNHLLNKSTATEHQITSRIAKTIDPNSNDKVDGPLVQQRLRQKSKWIDKLIIHYTHEARFESSKKDIHQLWNQTFKTTLVMNIKLTIGSRSLTKTLIRRRPQQKAINITTNNNNNHLCFKRRIHIFLTNIVSTLFISVHLLPSCTTFS